jgi:hypothetical protein
MTVLGLATSYYQCLGGMLDGSALPLAKPWRTTKRLVKLVARSNRSLCSVCLKWS